MCPAFGAVRNLLRMEDAMPIVISSGDGCLYGHTFVAHFYVANRPIYSPGVSSEVWAKGSAFDELRAMVYEMAEKHAPALIPICSLCVSDTVGLPFDPLTCRMKGADQGFGDDRLIVLQGGLAEDVQHLGHEAMAELREGVFGRMGTWIVQL